MEQVKQLQACTRIPIRVGTSSLLVVGMVIVFTNWKDVVTLGSLTI